MAIEVVRRLVDDEANRMPAANSYKLYFTASERTLFGMDVCNGEGADARIRIFVIPGSDPWTDTFEPPPYTAVVKNRRIEADGTDGNEWVMPNKYINDGDRVAVWTDLVGVTFYGHGIEIID